MLVNKVAEQVISKQRVTDHGEVFTAEREVTAMLNLVKHETERIDSRFLEPACGTGNFLAPILQKKLGIVKTKYGKGQLEFERYAVAAVGSIYGVDIQGDNVRDCQERLLAIFNDTYTALYRDRCKDDCRNTVRFILSKNIVWGDALSLKTVFGQSTPIVFSEWSLVSGSMMKRRDYIFGELIPDNQEDAGLFTPTNVSDIGTPVFIPKTIKEYPLCHFLNLVHENTN